MTNQSLPCPTNFSSRGNNASNALGDVLIPKYLFKHFILRYIQVTASFTTADQSCILMMKFPKFYLKEHQICLTVFRIGEESVYLIYFSGFSLPVFSGGYQRLPAYRELFNEIEGKLLVLTYKILLQNKKEVYDIYEQFNHLKEKSLEGSKDGTCSDVRT